MLLMVVAYKIIYPKRIIIIEQEVESFLDFVIFLEIGKAEGWFLVLGWE